MANDRDKYRRCVKLSKRYMKKRKLDKAWKCLDKANRLYPKKKTERLMEKLKKKLKKSSKRRLSDNSSDKSYNSDDSNNDSCTEPTTKKPKQSHESSTAYSYTVFKETNKDEAYRCIEKAEKCIQSKELELAEKFVLKSIKLFHISKADELLKNIKEIKENNKPKHTEEQENLVKKVKNSENYYAMLNIRSTATVPEIKKAYKKLALLLHPDKNPAPGSGEVFAVVSNAVNTLCDHEKRKTYDQTLNKPTSSQHSSCQSSPTSPCSEFMWHYYHNEYSSPDYNYDSENDYDFYYDYYD